MAEEAIVTSIGIGGTRTHSEGSSSAGSGGNGGSGGVDIATVRDMITQSEEKLDTKFIALEDRIEGHLKKLDNMPSTSTIWTAAISAAAGVLGIAMAVLAIGGDRFDGGIGIGTAIGNKFAENKIAINENRKKAEEERAELRSSVDQILNRLDAVITRIDADAAKK